MTDHWKRDTLAMASLIMWILGPFCVSTFESRLCVLGAATVLALLAIAYRPVRP